nr:MAG TPA: Type I restriction enzyme Methylase [Bacteriophage sp.]
MNFLDDWNKKNKQTQKKAGVQSASLPAAQKAELKAPLTLTKSGVVMADGKGGGKLITPTLGPKAAQTPLVKPMAVQNVQRSGQLVNTGTMLSDTGSNKRQAPLTLTKSGVVMADGKGGGKLITPTLGPKAAQTPVVKPMAARNAQRQLVNTGTMLSDTGSNKRQVPAVTTPKGKAQRTVDDLPDIAAFGAGAYGADKKPLQGFLARAGKTVSGGAKGSLAGNMDAMGVAYQAGQGGRTQRNTEELRDAQWAVARAKYAYDTDRSPAAKSELDNALTKMRAFATVLGDGAYEQALDAAYDAAARFGTADLNELYNSLGNVQPAQGTGVQQRAGEAARDLAADVQESANRDIEAAKTGVSKFWQNAIDAGASMTQSGIDAAASAILGLRPTRLNGGYALMGNVVEKRLPGAMIPFATRAFGGAAMEAREGGGDLTQQIAYGAGIGSVEVATELISNVALPFAKAYGGGALDDVVQRGIQKAVSKLGKTEAGKRALNAVLQMTASGAGEGFEELVAQWAEWQMPRIYGGDVESVEDNLADSLQSFIVGGMSGVAGSLVSPDTYRYKGGETSTAEEGQETGWYRGMDGKWRFNEQQGVEGDENAQYSIHATRDLSIKNQMKEYRAGQLTGHDEFYYGETPEILDAAGLARRPLVMSQTDFRKSRSEKHNVPPRAMTRLAEALEDPVLSFEMGDRIGILTKDIDGDGKPLLIAVQNDVELDGERVNRIKSAYGLDNPQAWIANQIAAGKKLRIYDNEKADSFLNGFGYLAERTEDYRLGDTIPEIRGNVNTENGGFVPLELSRLVDANGMDAAQRTAWRQALEQMPREKQMQFEMAADIARRFGAVVQARTMADGVQGSYQDGVISIATTAVDPVRQVLIHELTHHMESSGLYSRFSDAALQFVAEDMGADVDTLRRAVMADYARAGVALDEDGATREIVAKFAEEKLFTDEETVRRLLARDRNLFQRVYDWIRDTVAKLQGTREQRRLIDAQNLYERALRQAADGTQDSGAQLLYAGENARTADLDALTRAAQMEADGTDARTIRRETGWFRGMDGKWRFEIDDSGMEYRRDGDARLMEESGYRRLQELTDKWAQNAQDQGEPLTAEELAESEKLESEYYDRAWSEKYELADFLRHSDLFEAYPALRHTSVVFKETMPGIGGYYDKTMDAIVLSKDLIGSPERTLVHEIQHVIQGTEEFAGGSSPNYWKYKNKDGQGYVSDRRFVEAENRMHEAMDAMPPAVQETVRQINRAKLAQDWDEVLRLEESLYNGPYADMYSDYTQADFDRRARTDYFKNANTLELYRNTAGEIEARDAANRRGYTPEQRRQLSPDLGNEATVFTEDGSGWSHSASYDPETASIKEQIENSRTILNRMEVVARASVPTNLKNKDGAAAWAAEHLRGSGYRVDRQGYGDIFFSKKDLDKGLRYADTSEEKAALAVLPQVLKRGIEIGDHANHKQRTKQTVTFAAPVELNGVRGNMGVVVNRNGNHYYAHRIVLPDGTAFRFSDTNDNAAQELSRGVADIRSLADTTSAASGTSIPTGGGNVNTNRAAARKAAQLATIERSNPFDPELGAHTWIRSAEDILTYREAIDSFGGVDDVTPDFRASDVQRALDSGYMTVYSSYPIELGTFVTPSRMEAQNYAGDGHVYSKRVPLDDVAWLDEVQGQYTGPVAQEQLSTGRSIGEMTGEDADTWRGVDTGRVTQENGLFRRDTGDAAAEDVISWQGLYGGSDRTAPSERVTEPVTAQDAAERNTYMERLARDENIIGDDPYTVSDAIYDERLRRLERREAPPERTAEQVTQADLDDLTRLYADQADPIGTREDRIRDTESMVTDHTAPVRKSAREKARETWSYIYRKMVDAGHSVSKVSEAVNDPYLYQFYNQARASASAGVSMIADAQTNVNAQRVGASLNDIFTPIRQRGEDYYHSFQMYMYDLHNIDRMSLSQNKDQAMLEARAALRDFDADHPEVRTDTEAQLRRLTEDPDPDIAEMARERLRLLRAVDRADAIRDKPVFSYDVTAEVSRERARRALREHPEFARYQQQVRTYIDNLMQYRVDSGLMTQENAEFLRRFYPNYVPTLRVTDGSAGAGRDRNAVRVGRTVGRARGGTEQLVPLHEALGKQTMKVVREGSKNRFGQRMLDDYIRAGESSAVNRYIQDAQEFDGSDFDPDTLNDVSNQPLAKDKVFTVFRDGKLWELTVDDTMFDALKALSPDAVESNTITKVIRASNNLFKSLVTGYNPTFLLRNTVRDLQTAGLYTRDGRAFLRNYPRALEEIRNNGEYWQMYKALGGSYSSVFDYATGTVKEPTGRAAKLMARLESLNMAAEQAPRLAEFMSVVEKGGVNSETLADALYAAADVTVNFGRSGTLGKVLNANYVPFLNPGIQGFDKLIRRVTETRGGREWAKLIGRAALLGIAPTLINALLYHDDEEWDDLRDSDKDTNYMFKLKDGIWLKIPKGRELSLLGITADRVADAVQGKDVDLIATLNTMGNQVAPANPLTTNIASALVDSALLDPDSPGRTWYGGDIESQRLQSYAPGQRYDSSTDVFSKAVGGALGISPKKLNYVLDQYTGVVGDFLLPLLTPQAERGMFAKAFTTDVVTNNRVSGDFFDEADELTYAKNGGDETAAVVSRFWSKQQSACSDLWKEIREVEASDLSNKEKRQKTRKLKAVVTGIQKNALSVEETYRAAAEKYLRQGMETDDAYRAANKACFGAEYALQTYNKDVYERAKSAKTNGVSYDDFYTYYFGTKGIKATGEKSAATQKFEFLQNSGMTLSAQAEIYFADMASDKTLEQQAELETDASITPEQFYRYKVASSGMTRKAEKMQAINSLDLTYAQKDALYYAEGWAQSTIGQAPWHNGYSGGYTASSGGNPFLRTSGSVTAQTNPFLRASAQRSSAQTNPFLRTGGKQSTTQTNPFLRGGDKQKG